MKFSLATAPARWTALAVSLLAGFFLSYLSIRNARAEHFLAQQTPEGLERAIRLEPGNAESWYLLGRYWQYSFDQQDLARAAASYRHAAALDPHSAKNWVELADVYEGLGRTDDARQAYREGRNAYPISPDVAWREGNFLLRQGETAAACAEFRRALEVQPSLAAAAVSRCWRANPDVHVILDEVLPPVREAYLEAVQFFVSEREGDAAIAAWRRLRPVAPGLPLAQSYPLFGLLMSAGRTTEAREIWLQARALAAVPEPPAAPGSLVWDGGFETAPDGGGFGWRLQQAPGMQMDLDADNKRSGAQALRIRFDGRTNFDFRHVVQYVAVEPETSYQLSGWVRTDSLSTDSGMRLFVYDPKDPATSGRLTSDVLGTEPWTHLELTFTTGRDTRLLVLCVRRLPTAKFDNKLGGTAWVDDVKLEPLGAAAKPR